MGESGLEYQPPTTEQKIASITKRNVDIERELAADRKILQGLLEEGRQSDHLEADKADAVNFSQRIRDLQAELERNQARLMELAK